MKKNKPTAQPSIQEQQQLLNLYNQGLFVEAVAEAEKLIVLFPEHGFGWKILAASLLNLGRINESLAANKKAIQFMPNEIDIHFNLGLAFNHLKNLLQFQLRCQLRSFVVGPALQATSHDVVPHHVWQFKLWVYNCDAFTVRILFVLPVYIHFS